MFGNTLFVWKRAATNLARALGFTALVSAIACTGLAGGQPNAAQRQVSFHLVSTSESVEKFAKIEFQLEGVASEELGRVSDFEAEITLPSGRTVRVPGFLYQPFERRTFRGQGARTDWLYPRGQPVWLVRFSPWETGRHQVRGLVRRSDGSVVSTPPAEFVCTPSQRRGFLRRSEKDSRFFATADGQAFFAVGQNLAFIGGSQYFTLAKVEETLPLLAAHGVNYLRVWTCCEDWALCIEGRKSAWTRTWHWKLPAEEMPPGDGYQPGRRCVVLAGKAETSLRVDPSWPVALLPETNYRFSGKVRVSPGTEVVCVIADRSPQVISRQESADKWTDFQIDFLTGPRQFWLGTVVFRLTLPGKAWFDALSLREVREDGTLGPELLWEADVNRPARGWYNPVDCVLLDYLVEAAAAHGVYLQLCMLTRDLYMDALSDPQSAEYEQAIADAKRFFRYAIARWGYSPAVGAWEYWNEMDPGKPTERFYEELGRFFEEHDPYRHLRTTSTWHPSPRDMRHPRLDIADVHYYLRPTERHLRDEVEAVLDRAKFLREHASSKPALLAEFGLATEKWGLADDMKADRQAIHFHNALWASALSGLSGTAMFWWWEQLDQLGAYRHYGPVARFVADIPWESGTLVPFDGVSADQSVRIVGLRTENTAWCWLINRRATWVGSLSRGEKLTPAPAGEFVLPGLRRQAYRLEGVDTREGRPVELPGLVAEPAPEGLRIKYPAIERDVALRVRPAR